MKKINIAIFASGSGSNAMKIISYFDSHPTIRVALLLTNKSTASILEKSKDVVSQVIIDNEKAQDGFFLQKILIDYSIDYIILAGYLRKIPEYLVSVFPNRIINIHPALLPKFGGKGMYGMNVHKAVFAAKEKESGITIHLVNENYDDGVFLAQYTVSLSENDTPEDIQQKVLKIEHQYFASEIEKYILAHHEIR